MCGMGLAGFDPAPLVIVGAARAAGGKRSHVVIFSSVLLIGTAALGTGLTFLAGPAIRHLNLMRIADSWEGHLASVIFGVFFLVWGVLKLSRLIRGEDPDKLEDAEVEKKAHEIEEGTGKQKGLWGLIGVAVIFLGIVLLDPPFPAAIVFSATGHHNIVLVSLGFLLWAIVSQFPLVILTVATFFGADEKVVSITEKAMNKLKPAFRWVVSILAIAAGLFLAAWSVHGWIW